MPWLAATILPSFCWFALVRMRQAGETLTEMRHLTESENTFRLVLTCPTLQEPKKGRTQAGDFERQVEQIRKDIKAVRANLDAAEK